MKRRVLVFALTLLLISMLSVALNIPLGQADAGGIGKYLTIEIIGEGYVNATKIKSGETWIFEENGIEKVGAGTVELEAFAYEGWNFSHWGGDLTGSENPTDYKTRKYGYVLAVFAKRNYTITASAIGNGTIVPVDNELEEDGVLVEYGANQTFIFVPDEGNHTSAIRVDGVYLSSFAENYTFYNVTADHTIEVHFSADGTATVQAGNNVTVFLASSAGLTFDDTVDGVATGEEKTDYPVGTLVVVWDINVPPIFNGSVLVALQYDDTGLNDTEGSLRLIRGETLEALRSDVNGDLVVDGTDVSIVANAVKQSIWYDPLLDINNDGNVTEADVHIVNENKGAILVELPGGVDPDNNIIYGWTDQFSIFGAH